MRAFDVLRDWRRCVGADLLPGLHGHQAKALADFSFAAAAAGHCHARRLAAHVPTAAAPASHVRRFERLLANRRLDPTAAQRAVAGHVMAGWAGRTALLMLDETAGAGGLRVMWVRVGCGKRALPVACRRYRLRKSPRPLPALVRGLLAQAAAGRPAGCRPVLPADRGLAWPTLVDWCRAHGWAFVLRLQGQTKVRTADGAVRAARDLAPRRGRSWFGHADVFRKAGWRAAGVAAVWARGMKEPWLPVADGPGSLRHVRAYAKRMWVEESFRDDKSSGFQWQASRVTRPAHAARLLVVLALAMILAVSLGARLLRAGGRRRFDPHRRRRLSVFQLGLTLFRFALAHGDDTALRLDRLFIHPP